MKITLIFFCLCMIFLLSNSQFQNYINTVNNLNISSTWNCAQKINGVNSSDFCSNLNTNSSPPNWTCCFFNSTSMIQPVNLLYSGNAFCLPIMKSQVPNLTSLIGNQNYFGISSISFYTQECSSSKFKTLRKIVFIFLILILI